MALVGPSGGGKSTIASLVPRFWDVDEGRVLVGGVDVRDVPRSELMDSVSFVFQNTRLFKRSLIDNIRFARPSATRAEVEAAAHAAQCDDIIAKLPEGLDTVVGAKGVYLSGGECQRIALARAILKDAPIVVLDEATAFADPENEALIQRALARTYARQDRSHDCTPAIDRGGRGQDLRRGERGHLGIGIPRGSCRKQGSVSPGCGRTIRNQSLGESEGVPTMLREKFALTERGALRVQERRVLLRSRQPRHDGTHWRAVHGDQRLPGSSARPSKPLPALGGYLAAIVVILLLMLLTQWLEYHFTYNVVYGESARKRIELAEVLRRLPLSFFGRRDLSDLTTTIMKDCADQERMFSHIMPLLFGTGASTILISIMLLLFNWKMAIAALWVLPIALLIIAFSRKSQDAKGAVSHRPPA